MNSTSFEKGLYEFLDIAHPTLFEEIVSKKTLDDDLKAKLKTALNEFKTKFVSVRKSERKAGVP